MTASSQQPSRRLRGVALAARVLWWGMVAAWLAFALTWGALHGLIVPRLEQLRPWLEQQASRQLGVELHIGSLRAQADSWRHLPTIEVRDVSVHDAQGEETLRLGRVLATLSPRSLWRLGFEQLVIEQPRLEVIRRADGRIEVAGIVLASQDTGETRAADWFFGQRQVVVQGGTLVWRDEKTAGAAPLAPLALGNVQLVVRNHGLRHDFRLDADPPEGWGERAHIAGQMRQPLITLHRGRWQDWDGQLYADFSRVDLAQLAPYAADWPSAMRLDAGVGRLRGWARIEGGAPRETTVDLAMRDVVARRQMPGGATEPGAAPLALADLSGRLTWQDLPRGFALQTQDLQFSLPGGLRWPGGNARLSWQAAGTLAPAQASLTGDALDLGTLALIAQRLPLDTPTRDWLAGYAPSGVVRHIQAQWSGRPATTGAGVPLAADAGPAAEAPPWWERSTWQARGEIDQLSLAAGAAEPPSRPGAAPHPGRPGVSGARVAFDLNQDGGSAELAIRQGELVFPGVFEEPAIAMDDLQAQLAWHRRGEQHTVEVTRLAFANADAAGWANGRWQTTPGAADGLPGHLWLDGELTRANGTRVHRYLPLEIPELTRHYVRDAVRAGQATRTVFKVDSALDHFPPETAKAGVFSIVADLKDVDFDYVPPSVAAQTDPPGHWPAFSQLDAQLVFDHRSMEVRQAQGSVDGLRQLRVARAWARIAELGHDAPVLETGGQVSGPLAQALEFVRRSPLDGLTGNAFAEAQGSGDTSTQLSLRIPLMDAQHTQVQGQVQLRGAAIQFLPGTPRLEQAQARVDFSEKGFQLSQARAHVFGGDLQFRGSGQHDSASGDFTSQFDGQGTLTAEGLSQSPDMPWLAPLGHAMAGQAGYRVRLGSVGGRLQGQIDSDLVGLAMQLPAPFGKTAQAPLPLHFESALTGPQEDRVRLRLGERVKADFVRDLASGYPRIRRGSIRIDEQGAPDAVLPAAGVDLGVRLDTLDVGAWQQVLAGGGPQQASAAPSAADVAADALRANAADPPAGDGAQGDRDSALASFLPTRLSVQARQLRYQGRSLNNLHLDGERQDRTWSATVSADELDGRLAYSQGAGERPGTLFARFKRVALDTRAAAGHVGAGNTSAAVNDLLDHQPETLPALDIEIEQLNLAGKDLGQLSVLATNRGRQPAAGGQGGDALARAGEVHEWQLDALSLTVPEGALKASGQWLIADGAAPAGRQRQTRLDFTLQTSNAGALLDRLGFANLFRRGQGDLKGSIAWTGSPLALDYPSLTGTLDIDMRDGQFLKADPGPARLLGVLSLQALPRRLTLDFRDAFSEGFAFDFIRGEARIQRGVATTNNLQMKGVSAAVLMDGQADLVRETQDIKVVVVPELNTGTMALIATAINPAIGLGTFLAQWVLKRPLLESVTRTFHLSGTWADPDIQAVPSTPAPTSSPASGAGAVSESPVQPATPGAR